MELFITLAALYLAQCLIWVAPNESLVLFFRPGLDSKKRRHALFVSGGGWRLGHPLPTAITLSGHDQIPIEGSEGDLEALSERFEWTIQHTRGLRWLGLAELALIAIIGPTAALLIGPEAAILFGVAPFALLHVSGLILMQKTRKSVLGDQPGQAEALVVAMLYPPSLMRAGAEMVRQALPNLSFLEVTALRLDDEEFEAYLRLQLGRLESPRFPGGAAEREYLLRVAGWRGLDSSKVLSPRARRDDSAESYCQACGQDYRKGFRFCRECELETRRYEA